MKDFLYRLLYYLRCFWEIRFFRGLFYLFVLFIFVVVLMDTVIMPAYTKHGQAVQVPDVTKMRFENAREILRSKGFHIIKMEERFDAQFPSGYVIEQNPRPGSQVKEGRRIYVILSKGQRRFEMPKLKDRSERDAKLILSKYGLVMGEKTYEYSTQYPEGVVIRQSIPPGVDVPMGTQVDITISLGAVPDQFTVPSLEGRTLDDARDLIARSGLRIGKIRYEVVSQLLPETVIKQSIKAGTKVNKDEAIDLVVSILPGNEEIR